MTTDRPESCRLESVSRRWTWDRSGGELPCVFKQESSTRTDDPNFTFHKVLRKRKTWDMKVNDCGVLLELGRVHTVSLPVSQPAPYHSYRGASCSYENYYDTGILTTVSHE